MTPAIRAELARGRVPGRVIRRVTGYKDWFGEVASVLVCGAVLAWDRIVSLTLAILLLIGSCGEVVRRVVAERRFLSRARRVLRERDLVRVLTADVRTIREWEYGYGEAFHLRPSLTFADERYDAAALGERCVAGPVRLLLVAIPSEQDDGKVVVREALVGIDLLPGATFRTIAPERAAPPRPAEGTPYGLRVQADD